MKIRFMSDLHLGFYINPLMWKRNFLIESKDTILVLAGDIFDGGGPNKKTIKNFVKYLCDKFYHVIFVPGNHEFYWSSFEDTFAKFRSLTFSNFHILNNSCVIIDDIRFLGTTLWFRETQDATMFNNMLSDFKLIEDFQQKVYEENKKSITFLQDNVDKNDIVITHHLPSYQSVQPVYIGEPTNCYYVCNMEELILSKEPSLWIHGHTHHSCDYSFQGTRIVCNPAGYPDSFYKLPTNPVFNIEKAVELNF